MLSLKMPAAKHKICRDAISEWGASISLNHSEDSYIALKTELYTKKSKWIHPTFNSIKELFILDEIEGIIKVKDFDYLNCKYERKLIELAHFFRSSIWSAYQVFMFCFHENLPLDKKDTTFILSYDNLFKESETS